MIDTATLQAGREADQRVAEALGWRGLRAPEQKGPVDLVGIPPGAEKELPVPFFSSSTAALLALEDWQRRTAEVVEVVISPNEGDRRYAAGPAHGPYYEAPTLWLAIARLIVGS